MIRLPNHGLSVAVWRLGPRTGVGANVELTPAILAELAQHIEPSELVDAIENLIAGAVLQEIARHREPPVVADSTVPRSLEAWCKGEA